VNQLSALTGDEAWRRNAATEIGNFPGAILNEAQIRYDAPRISE
jgi:hypothetical protein